MSDLDCPETSFSKPGFLETEPNGEQELESVRQKHVGRLLHRAARAFNTLALEKLHALGHSGLSLAHTNLLPYLDLGGTRIITLAERAGMTKQAAGQLVAQLEALGYLTRRPDPSDGRATLISFSRAGRDYLQDASRIKLDIEAHYRARLGDALWWQLGSGLEKLLEAREP